MPIFSGAKRPKIFLSYRRNDTRHAAGRLAAALAHYCEPDDLFFDIHSILPGADFRHKIESELKKCDYAFVLISLNWEGPREDGTYRINEKNDYVRKEVTTALACGVNVIPALIERPVPPQKDHIPSEMHRLLERNMVTLDHMSFETTIQRLALRFGWKAIGGNRIQSRINSTLSFMAGISVTATAPEIYRAISQQRFEGIDGSVTIYLSTALKQQILKIMSILQISDLDKALLATFSLGWALFDLVPKLDETIIGKGLRRLLVAEYRLHKPEAYDFPIREFDALTRFGLGIPAFKLADFDTRFDSFLEKPAKVALWRNIATRIDQGTTDYDALDVAERFSNTAALMLGASYLLRSPTTLTHFENLVSRSSN